MTVQFRLLGTSAGPGVPAFYCDCAACREAVANPQYARTRSGAFVKVDDQSILLDACPDLRRQLIREGIRAVDTLFMSHWHYDHFGGLGELEFYVRLKRLRPVTLYMPPEAMNQLKEAFPFLMDVYRVLPWEFGRCYKFGGLRLTPLPAKHSVQTAGFFLQAEKSAAYFTDTSGLPDETKKKIVGTDYLICDATLHGENWYPHSHMNIEEAVALGQEVGAKETVLTHFSMHYSEPVTVAELREEVHPYGNVVIALDGMVFEL